MSINISISNLAKIKKADVKINGLTVISGENDTGKSTVGKAIYSIIKSINTYSTSGAYDIKVSLIHEMYDTLKLVGRAINRKTPIFNKIRNKVSSYIRRPFMLFSENDDTLSEDSYRKKINNLTFQELSELMIELSKYAKKNEYWNDSIIRNKLEKLSKIVENYQDEKIQLSTNLLLEFQSCIGNILVNSEHPEEDGQISLSLQDKEVLKFHFNKDILLVQKYNKQDFDYIFDDATYIETPLLINEEFDLRYDSRSSFADIINKKKSAQNPVQKKIDYITKYIPGEIDFKNDKFSYKVSPLAVELALSSMASGVKSFNILQLLAQGGYIGRVSKLLIVDEPENHLHPEWQLRYAELIVSLVAQGANIILTSHSPYMIQALYYYAKQNSLDENKIAFYYTEKTNIKNYTEIKETKDLSIIFDKLSKPLERIVWD